MVINKDTLTAEQKELLDKGFEFELDEQGKIQVVETNEYIQFVQSEMIARINSEFDEKINSFLAKYPKREQDTFPQKVAEAKVVLGGGGSAYISGKAVALEMTDEEFAQKIIEKSNYFTQLYTELENKKDLAIKAIISGETPDEDEIIEIPVITE